MLETDDVDDDYFTPATNAALASIFQNNLQADEKGDNDSLKYLPSKSAASDGDFKTESECIFACALTGFEWFNNVYNPKGKLGFAILRYIKTDSYKIVLYDASKLILSCTNISSQLQIKVKRKVYITFNDNSQKYWSLYGSVEQLNKILEILVNLNVDIDRTSPDDKNKKPFLQTIQNPTDLESDIDLDDTIKSKSSIIKRMATLGHSMLTPATSAERAGALSDTSDTESNMQIPRYNISTSVEPRNNTVHQGRSDYQQCQTDTLNNFNSLSTEEHNMGQVSTCINYVSKFLPISNSPSNDLHILMAEQRMNNSEIRANMGRLTDKVDHVLYRISELDNQTKENRNSILNPIYEKLIIEYENKIRCYEKIIRTNKINVDSLVVEDNSSNNKLDTNNTSCNEVGTNKREHKDKDVSNLLNNIEHLKDELKKSRQENILLSEENKQIKQILQKKTEELAICETLEVQKAREPLQTTDTVDVVIKNIINDTFQNVSEKFENNISYSGNVIKSVFGAVMKKTTLSYLNENVN